MTLRTRREILVTPGPTTIPDEVLSAMHRPAIDLYSRELEEVTLGCLSDLRSIFATHGDLYIYAANGHGAWEAALANVLSRGDTVLVLESHFAKGWSEMAKMLGLKVELLAQDFRSALDPDLLREALAKDREHRIKAILVVQVDTASGVRNDIEAIRRAIDQARHPAFLMVDVIASLGAIPFEMDRWGVDVAVGAAQKALMMTPGLSFVAANAKAKEANQKADLRTLYWDWQFRDGVEHYGKYCGTCPEHLLFGLRKSLDLIKAEGLDAAHRRHRHIAEAARRAIAVWAQGGALSFNIERAEDRSDSVSVVRLDPGSTERLIRYCRDICGVVLGVNIGAVSGQGFRIGHMGEIGAATIFAALAAIETGLQAVAIPHGKGGVNAAMAHIAEVTGL
ncbi:aminotransferase class V-fold PLP-dependent enzyme [Bradyrhizobium sp. 15]|uniref:pyridoxal-phosphate-dependent aminotransferase family protein n=1 Tax=Bradyrhizobium sp. 15 TaxID=2782633 RepID=UPI001FFABD86|nr:aminotransferase class V-fold PLP-dependent enzyme [Bradyrhizobium sp. 15]MCK1440530.1 aminotransferase class V-fold PLP-dependent enzyme [Bradyrhizobium sp. 15]